MKHPKRLHIEIVDIGFTGVSKSQPVIAKFKAELRGHIFDLGIFIIDRNTIDTLRGDLKDIYKDVVWSLYKSSDKFKKDSSNPEKWDDMNVVYYHILFLTTDEMSIELFKEHKLSTGINPFT